MTRATNQLAIAALDNDPATRCAEAIHAEKRKRPALMILADVPNIIRPIITAAIAEAVTQSKLDAPYSVEQTTAKGKRKYLKGIPPTPEDVSAYSLEYGYPLHGERWCDLYAAKGWIVSGRAKMRDWQAAVRNWAANGWGQEGPRPIALKKLPPKPQDPRYAPEPSWDWRAEALRTLGIKELPEAWDTWENTPQEYRGKIITGHEQ